VRKTVQGFVYFIEEVGVDRVKIGFSRSPWKRLNGLQTSVSNDLRMLWCFAGTVENERYFHWLFGNHRVRGEWFVLSLVVAGFRYYGFEPDNFPKPDRWLFAPVPDGPRRLDLVLDPEQFEKDQDGYLIRKRKPRAKPKPKVAKTDRRKGKRPHWANEEVLAASAGKTVEEYREMKQQIRDEWERDHPGEVPYWRSG